MLLIRHLFCLFFVFISVIVGQLPNVDQATINRLKNMGINNVEDVKKLIENSKDNSFLQPNNFNDRGDLNKLDEENFKKDLIKNIESEKKSSINSISSDSDENNFNINTNKVDQISELIENSSDADIDSLSEYELKNFGYDIFNGNPDIFEKAFDESVDPNYLIGPGDEVIIMLWGETEFQEAYSVSRDGYLFVTNVGQIFVNGLTLEKLEKKLFRFLKKVYSSLDPNSGNATTFFDVSLGSLVLRPLRIFVLGEVLQPGGYSVKPSTTLFTSLYYFNGPSTNGSLRNIRLMRKNKKIVDIDFYDYLLTGKQTKDLRLQRDDVVFVPPRGKTVTVKGEIKRPAIYELKGDEGLLNLIDISGGLPTTTYRKRIQIDRILPPEIRLKTGMDRTLIDVNLSKVLKSNENYTLQDGDVIEFFKISEARSNTVSVVGPVVRSGVYDIGNGLTIKELISRADGLSGDAYKKRVDIIRMNDDGTELQMDYDLQLVMDGDINNNVNLISGDQVIIYSKSEMLYKENVSILGHVENPGIKPFREGMQIFDLVFSGGGFENQEHLNNTYFQRADLYRIDDSGTGKEIFSFRLDSVLVGRGFANELIEMGDEIRIYSIDDVEGLAEKTVSISGFVKRDGSYPLYDGLRIKELLFLAGGFEDSTHLKNTILNRADLIRYNEESFTKDIKSFNLKDVLFSSNEEKNFLLKDKDQIRIYSKGMFQNVNEVYIYGKINLPGKFELKNAMSLSDLILEAGGLSGESENFRIEIARYDKGTNDKDADVQIIEAEFKKDFIFFSEDGGNIKSNNINDIQLKTDDYIFVRSEETSKNQKLINISGFVNYPGDYVITSPNEKVTDIIARAGGLKSNAYPRASSLIRNNQKIQLSFHEIVKNARSKFNFKVMDGDSINIGSKPNLVTILGGVSNPGNYQYTKGYRLDDYVKLAGGFTDDADRLASFVTYPDGKSRKVKLFNLSPKVLDGSVINVVQLPEKEPFNFTEYATSITSIWADITQAYFMITLALRGNS